MDEKKVNYIFNVTSNFHDTITEIYEYSAEDSDEKAISLINNLITKLRTLKNNLIKN